MFSLDDFYDAAHNGRQPDIDGFCDFVNSFDHVILWGAGNLGTAIGRKFTQLNLKISAYWDLRATELSRVNGIEVIEPFSGYASATSLIVFCITNVFISEVTGNQLKEKGYGNVLQGEDLYQALICPFGRDKRLDIRICRDLPECNVCTCRKLDNIIHNTFVTEDHESLHFPNITFVISQKCSLNCKYCYSYTNNYPPDQRVNFPFERIREDIDRFFDAVDSVTLVPLIGGEPFLHPDIGKIVNKFLEKRNFGVLNVTTNGICKITAQNLDGFQDDRTRVFFSNYLESLTTRQQDLFHKNLDFVRSQGVTAIVYNATPQWTVPVTLNNKFHSLETITTMKSNCMMKATNGKYVKNGRFYPCTIIDSVHNLGVADYNLDYLEIDGTSTADELRLAIRDVMKLPYYKTCSHCGNRGEITAKAGVQGFTDYINVG